MSASRRIAALLGCALAGAALGVLGAFFQALRLVVSSPVGTIPIPWGALAMLMVVVLAIRALASALDSQGAGWLVFAGWLSTTVLLAMESPSGDLAISAGGRQWAYLLIGAVAGAAAAVIPVRRRRALPA